MKTSEQTDKILPAFAALAEPFPAKDVEWRLGRCGESNGKLWGMALTYITNRAIMDRLDSVVGPQNWCNEYREGPGGGVICAISIRIDGEWITKWDGAENTNMEAVKGGLSGAMKRAAVQWGIGRYLYDLEEGWATCYTDMKKGRFRGQTKDKKRFSWDPPELPQWALPEAARSTQRKPQPAPNPPAPAPDAVLSDEVVESRIAAAMSLPDLKRLSAEMTDDQKLKYKLRFAARRKAIEEDAGA